MTVDVSPDTLVYRTFMASPDVHSIFASVRKVTGAWLEQKYGQVPLTSGVHHLRDDAVLTRLAAYVADGTEQALRLELRENKPEATWRTTITAGLADTSGALVAVTLEAFPNDGRALTPRRPRVVRDLVGELRAHDGLARLSQQPLEVPAARATNLVDVLCDPKRSLPVLVAARPVRETPLWSDRMHRLLPGCAGTASLYLLPDEEAVDALRDQIGSHHYVAPGALRTFLPAVDPAWAPDGRRHRYLTRTRLSDPTDHAWKAVTPTVQRIVTRVPIPEALRALVFPDAGQVQQQRRREALRLNHAANIDALTTTVNDLEQLLAIADQEIDDLRAARDLSDKRAEAQEQQLRHVQRQADSDLEDALAALDEAEQAHAEAAELRLRLLRSGPVETPTVEHQDGVPNSFEELWGRLGAFTRIVVTAPRPTALLLDEADRGRLFAAKTWKALRALDDYAHTLAEFKGTFYQYCQSGLPGSKWPVKQVAMAESGITMEMYGDERLFQVPVEVDMTGRLAMQAHLRIAEAGTTSPRLYFHDDRRGVTGTVIVGYIGPHLTNTRTN